MDNIDNPTGPPDKRKWTGTNTAMAALSGLAHLSDWTHTVDMARNHYDTMHEGNPILGKYPSVGKINTVNVLGELANQGIGHALPNPYRNIWYALSGLVEGAYGLKGHNQGLKMNFKF